MAYTRFVVEAEGGKTEKAGKVFLTLHCALVLAFIFAGKVLISTLRRLERIPKARKP